MALIRSKFLALLSVCAVGLFMTLFAFGADKPAVDKPLVAPFPRYNVQYAGQLLFITDNVTNKLYMYENEEKASKLRQVLDLTQTGKNELTTQKDD